MLITIDDLRRYTVARSFSKPATLKRVLQGMGFVQADPIRAPARAQDLILRHRVKGYRAGDLERRYRSLDVEEDFFVNYGYVARPLQALMHPRSDSRVPADEVGRPWPAAQKKRAQLLLEFVRGRGEVHPRVVDEHFSHGTVKNYWGGSSSATTRLLEAMQYCGMLRVARRENGIRIYAVRRYAPAPGEEFAPGGAKPESKHLLAAGRRPRLTSGGRAEAQNDGAKLHARIDALVDVVVRIYAPLPGPSLAFYLRRLRYAVPQWQGELTSALQRAKERLSHARVDGVEWYWPTTGDVLAHGREATDGRPYNLTHDTVRLLAPFDPVVHDRTRFELLWGWVYRFEAYTPAAKRKLGYYAMPLLWRDRVIGWGNLSVKNGELKSEFGYVGPQPRERVFKRELEAELNRMRAFLGLDS